MSELVPEGWSQSRFDEFAVLQRGFDLPTQDRVFGKYPILGSTGIIGYHNESRVSGAGVVTGRSGSIGEVRYVENDFWALNTSLYIKEFHGNSRKYVYYFLDQFDLSRYGTGTGVPTLNRNDVHLVPIIYPPLPEQQKIATILTSVDNVIEKTEAQINKLQDLKKGMMQELLSPQEGSKQAKAFGHTEFKDSPVGRIPKGWRLKELEDLSSAPICYGIVQVGEYVADGVPVMAIKNLGKGFGSNLNKTSKEIERKYVRSRIHGGDLLISVKGTIGRVDVVPLDFKGNISRDIVRIRPTKEITSEYLKYFFQSTQGITLIEHTSVGTTRAELSVHRLKKMVIPVPDLGEQINLVNIISSIDKKLSRSKEKFESLGELKKALMQDLLTGKVRVKTNESEKEAVVG